PGRAPVFGIRINHSEPIAAILETRIPANLQKREAVDAERVTRSIVAAEVGVRNPVAAVTAALLPGAVFGVPVACSTVLPIAPLCDLLRLLLLLRALFLHGPFGSLLLRCALLLSVLCSRGLLLCRSGGLLLGLLSFRCAL